MDGHHEELVELFMNTLGDKVANREDGITQDSPVGDYWSKGYQAVILYQNATKVPKYDNNKLWGGKKHIKSKWPNCGNTDELHDKLEEIVKSRNAAQFFVLQGILTPDVELIKDQLMDGDGVSIKTISDKCGRRVVDWVEDEWNSQPLNIVIVDFYENCSMIPSIISYNRKASWETNLKWRQNCTYISLNRTLEIP